ncbi:MAG: uracil-DNA glycosylase [Alphaproteobacteria bacterium]|nr:uracil-DNA glycosylase [Alphaproteobacteria bacterium]
MNGSSSALSDLSWLVDAGADEALLDEPVNRFQAKPTQTAAPMRGNDPATHAPASRPIPTRPLPQKTQAPAATTNRGTDGDPIGEAMALAAGCATLAELKAALESFEGSPLRKSATNTVFADGVPDYGIMFIGEAPGRDEDRMGLPFVGRAGKLLDRMLAAIHLDRKSNAYITNVANWRPPDNREPTPEEAAINLPFLRRHVELVNPGVIVLLGATAARHVMGKTDGIMRLRGKWLEYHVNGRMVPVMPTLHPAYLLRQPAHKKFAWHDLQLIEEKIMELGLLNAAIRN